MRARRQTAAQYCAPGEERRRAVRPIFAYMRNMGITRAWLARQLGMSGQALTNIEYGMFLPADFVERASRALRMTREAA